MNNTKEKSSLKKRAYKVAIIFLTLTVCIINSKYIYAEEENTAQEELSSKLEFGKYVEIINDYVKNSGMESIDIDKLASDLVTGEKIDHSYIFKTVLSLFGREILNALNGSVAIYIIIIIMAIITSFDMEEKGDVTKIAKLVCFIGISSLTIKTFLEVITTFKNVVNILTTTMQVISPFLLSVLISTGAISTTGLVQPILLFLASLVGFIVNYVVIPFFTISVSFNVIYSISENLRIEKVSKMFSSSAIWIIGVLFTLFLGVLALETTVSSSVDSLAVKTTQAAVSNFVPVVGKFFSDSFETVVGATKIVGKAGGVVGIIAIVLISLVPILKLGSVLVIYSILNVLIEPICSDTKVTKYIENFVNVYKNLFGILIGIIILFVISTGIILNLINNIVV